MKLYKKKWFPMFLQGLITACMVVGGLVIISLPFIVSFAIGYDLYSKTSDLQGYFLIMLCILYPSGIIGLIVLFHARRLLKRINESQPFIKENSKRIKYIARLAAVLCVIYGVAVFLVPSFFVLILFVVFGLISLFTSVFGELFQKAVDYKEENDYTI